MTDNLDTVDDLWLTATDIAKETGVSKQAVSKRLARLVEQGQIETRRGPRNTLLVRVAEYLRVIGQTEDSIRAANGRKRQPETPRAVATPAAEALSAAAPVQPGEDGHTGTLNYHQARKARIDADLKKLELDERLSHLVQTADVEAAMIRCAQAMVRRIDALPSVAAELAAVVAREGEAGVRVYLKGFARDLRQDLANEMRLAPRAARADEQTEARATEDRTPPAVMAAPALLV